MNHKRKRPRRQLKLRKTDEAERQTAEACLRWIENG